MKCFRCRKKISTDENYFKFIEVINRKEVRIDYCHKKCWDDVKSDLAVNKKSMNMLKGMEEYLKRTGVLPEQVVQI